MIADSPRGHPIADCPFALRGAPQPAAAWCCAWFCRSESEKTKHINRKAPLCRRLKLLSTKPRVKGCTND
jgi:hypothetical protein